MKWVWGLVFVLFAGCASKPYLPEGHRVLPKTSAEGFLEPDSVSTPVGPTTEIRPGFLIQVSSPVDTKLNGSYRVALDGNVKLPYGVNIQAAGKSLQNLTGQITAQMQKFYKSGAQVKIQITDKKYYVEVRGLVQKPGVILVSEREKIEDVIKKSGELSLTKEARVIQIVRGQNTYYVDLEEYFQGRGLNLSPRWFGGEKVFFIQASTALGDEDSSSIQILGDVKNPGALAFKDTADLYHYIVKAGGTTPTSDLDRVQVVRQTANGPVVTTGTAEEIAKNIKLEPGDTVFMGSGLPGRFERNVQVGTLAATILSAIGILIIAL